MSQLTITLDEKLLQTLRQQAHQRGQELDSWVADLLAEAARPVAEPVAPAQPAAEPSTPLSPRIQRLFGAVQVPADFNYQKTLDEAMQERFGA